MIVVSLFLGILVAWIIVQFFAPSPILSYFKSESTDGGGYPLEKNDDDGSLVAAGLMATKHAPPAPAPVTVDTVAAPIEPISKPSPAPPSVPVPASTTQVAVPTAAVPVQAMPTPTPSPMPVVASVPPVPMATSTVPSARVPSV